jgi:class 3 adenylate cyclase/catechol 2,3-dioxygenase-like lactoylglutathione lyase family enzyme
MLTLAQYQDAAAQALKQGAPLVAFDTAAEGLRHAPDDPRLRQLLALALARSGASREANQLLHALVSEGHTDEETIGLLARTYKDLWAAAQEPGARRRYLEQAFHWYLEAHRHTDGYWTAINAATMAWLLDNREQARRLALHVRERCLDLLKGAPGGHDRYWLLATLGEAALLLRDLPAAEAWYREAVGLGLHGVADLVSTRRNARLILRHAQADPTAIDACFRIPRVAVFAGHLIDRPGRPTPRFPPDLEEEIGREILARLRRHDVGFGYASAGAGGDILFLEGLLATGAESHIILPYNREQFLEDSVDYLPGSNWAERYRAVLERATQVTTGSEQRMLVGSMSYEFGFLLLDGKAAVHAAELETELVCLALWDGQPGDGAGGTAASIAHWRHANRQIDIVDLRLLAGGQGPVLVRPASEPAARVESVTPASGFDAQLVGLLFADVAGFSKLTEEQIPRFVDQYLRQIADTLAQGDERPLLTNTWGDGLYLVFRGVGETGRFALRLSKTLGATDWSAHGLPGTLSLRIAVHAGPAYACLDPITSRPNYLGAHVALAARIEPITPPGQVYGSGAFAALAKAYQVREFECTYVGQTPLAKAYGIMPMYVLRSTG